jgi:hypothetical protein
MDLNYQVVRSSKRKKLTITVERDRSVIVHAPEGTADDTIRRVVNSKRQWIFDKLGHPQKYQDLPHPPGKELVSGESALFLGRSYRIEIVKTGLSQITLAERLFVPAPQDDEGVSRLRNWYISQARQVIIPRVNAHAHQLGVQIGEAKIVDSRYRWGSCTVNDNVTFNWRLIKAPMSVIDYVIVHELAHLLETNHTPRFWNIIRAQAPTMEKAKAWLKEHGALLEQAI